MENFMNMNINRCFRVIPLVIVATAFQFASYGQGVGIGTSSPNNSAILDLNSPSKGFLPPRMTSLQRRAISNPASGLVVYDTNTDSFWFYDNGIWNELITANKLSNSLPRNRFNPNGNQGDNFGFSISLGSNGNFGLVGSPMLDNGGSGTCHFLSYSQNNLWVMGSLNPSGLAAGDAYGYAVAMDRDNGGTMCVASAPFDDSSTVSNMGCAYFFDNLGFRNKVYAPQEQRVANAKFGRSVDISGSSDKGYAIIGAPGANGNKGAAFIYQYNPNTNTWAFEATLTDNNGEVADSFGLAVSLFYNPAGDTAWAFIGAPYDDESGVINLGSVTVYRKAAFTQVWTRVAKIVPGDISFLGFGYALDDVFRCGHLFVGSPFRFFGIGDMTRVTLSSIAGSTAVFTQSSMPTPCCSQGLGVPGIGFCVSAASINSGLCNEITILSGSFSGIISNNSSSSNFGNVFLYRFFNGAFLNTERVTDPYVESNGYGFGRALSIHGASQHVLIGSPNERVEGINGRGKIQFRRLDN